ncbi:MAG TPA: 4Fe-4S dicluster domain-containing protein [Candidimonas sp.]|nr:4Fe-4S dicluster domain-containing protein [Candidimonas sp.]
MKKWNLVIDVEKCENCNNCALATKDEHIGNDFPGYAASQPSHGHHWIHIHRQVRGSAPMTDVAYLPTMCNQCDNAPCIQAAGDGSIYKRRDGIVIIDPVKAKGRQDLVSSCPYGAIWWNAELDLPQKWIFDAHLLDQGASEPRCTQACPTGSMRAVKVDDAQMDAMAKAEGLEVLKPALGTKPRVYYKNLYRYSKCFIGGSVVASINGVMECADQVVVTLSKKGEQQASTTTDAFGDFKFDGLAPNSGSYQLGFSHLDMGVTTRTVELEDSVYLGAIYLDEARQ